MTPERELELHQRLVALEREKQDFRIGRARARESLVEFVKQMVPDIRPAKFHLLMAEKLEAVERGEIPRLLLALPPGHGKSSWASIWFPAWYLGRNPSVSIIAASHTDKLAEKWSRRVRGLLFTPEYQKIFDTRISDKTQAAGEWETSATPIGEYFAAGITAGISGRRSHLAIIDDPFKSHADADSPTVREAVWEWYVNDLHNRQHPGGRIILIQTRWHEDDLAGRIIEQMGQGGEHWEVLSLPAEAEADDILGREEGAYLWPEYFTPEIYATKKRMMTPRDWSALFQQRPTPPGGLFFEEQWFKWYDKAPKNLVKYGASDYAVTQDGGDYTVHGVFGIDTEDNIYIIDWWRKQTSSDKWIEALLDLMKKHKPMAWGEEKDQITKSMGPFIVKRMRERRVRCLRRQYSSKGGDKSVKARSWEWTRVLVGSDEQNEYPINILSTLSTSYIQSAQCECYARAGDAYMCVRTRRRTQPMGGISMAPLGNPETRYRVRGSRSSVPSIAVTRAKFDSSMPMAYGCPKKRGGAGRA